MRNLIPLFLCFFILMGVDAQTNDDPSKQKTTLTIGEVYDFNVGDEFHFSTYMGPGSSDNPRSPNGQRYIITGKTFSVNLDTVCYTRDHFDYTTEPFTPLQYQFDNYTSQICYAHLDSLVQTLIPFEDTLSLPTMSFFSKFSTDSADYCDSLLFRYYFFFNAYQLTNVYGKGIGHVFHVTNDMGNHPPFFHHYQLHYFSKGGVPCGTPDNTTLDVQPIAASAGDWLVYPNPVSHIMRILNPEVPLVDARLILMDMSGRIVSEMELQAGAQLWTMDVSGLSSGHYIARFVTDQGTAHNLRIVKL